ncbi:MAG TPA: prolyl oligopeptidase family serine peptidase [Blastocatellia bacterium]|nr:prolyl oligopeptidase family serine peptidase [Blastocatellia bacterium]
MKLLESFRTDQKARPAITVLWLLLLLLVPTVALAQGHKAKQEKSGAARRVKQYSIEQFLDTTKITGSSFSFDDKSILFSSNKTGIFNVYSVPVSGGEPKQLTHSTTESTFAISYFPGDSRVLFTHDQGGNENNHIYLLDADGKERDLTPGDKLKAQFLGWSQDGKAFYFMTNERDARFFDIYKMNAGSFERTPLYQDSTGYQFGDITNDEKYIAFSKANTTADGDVYLYDSATKEMKLITPHKGEVNSAPSSFDPQSRYLLYNTDSGSEFSYLARYELATGKIEPVEKTNWDIVFSSFSHNGKYRVVGINEDARTRIKVYDRASGKTLALPTFPEGEITAVNISKSERLMAFYFNGDRSPSDLYVYDFATKQARKLTTSLNPEIAPADLVESQVIRYKSFDGMQVPSILYKPQQASASAKVPALVWVHGGPGGQTRTGYSGVIQYLVNHGYVVLGVNNRGSSGYGKTFFAADDLKHGREPLWDCVEAKKYLASLGYVDTSRIGIIGGSYGGYMVLAALAFKPDEFAVGVDLFGVSNWLRTLESIPPYWESFRKALYKEIGDPATDKENLKAISPLFHTDKITKPLLVLQGKNDPRVIKPESDEIVDAVKKKGGIVDYVVFDNEGHGFTKKANEMRGYKAVLDFLDKYLRGAEAGK